MSRFPNRVRQKPDRDSLGFWCTTTFVFENQPFPIFPPISSFSRATTAAGHVPDTVHRPVDGHTVAVVVVGSSSSGQCWRVYARPGSHLCQCAFAIVIVRIAIVTVVGRIAQQPGQQHVPGVQCQRSECCLYAAKPEPFQ